MVQALYQSLIIPQVYCILPLFLNVQYRSLKVCRVLLFTAWFESAQHQSTSVQLHKESFLEGDVVYSAHEVVSDHLFQGVPKVAELHEGS